MARLAATNSIAFVLGPAVSAALIAVNLRFPFFVSGAISGIAFILSFFLKESNMAYLQRKQQQHSTTTSASVSVAKESHSTSSSVASASERVHFKPIMPFCFFLEFCTSWTGGCYNSRYAIYLSDKFGVTTTLFATMLCIQGIWCFLLQSVLYPCLSTRCKIPIPHLAVVGMFLEVAAHLAIALAPNAFMGLAPVFVYLLGWSLVCPASTSILSVFPLFLFSLIE